MGAELRSQGGRPSFPAGAHPRGRRPPAQPRRGRDAGLRLRRPAPGAPRARRPGAGDRLRRHALDARRLPGRRRRLEALRAPPGLELRRSRGARPPPRPHRRHLDRLPRRVRSPPAPRPSSSSTPGEDCSIAERWRALALPPLRKIVDALQGKVPLIYYINGGAHLLAALAELPVDVLSVDWRVPLSKVRQAIGGRDPRSSRATSTPRPSSPRSPRSSAARPSFSKTAAAVRTSSTSATASCRRPRSRTRRRSWRLSSGYRPLERRYLTAVAELPRPKTLTPAPLPTTPSPSPGEGSRLERSGCSSLLSFMSLSCCSPSSPGEGGGRRREKRAGGDEGLGRGPDPIRETPDPRRGAWAP